MKSNQSEQEEGENTPITKGITQEEYVSSLTKMLAELAQANHQEFMDKIHKIKMGKILDSTDPGQIKVCEFLKNEQTKKNSILNSNKYQEITPLATLRLRKYENCSYYFEVQHMHNVKFTYLNVNHRYLYIFNRCFLPEGYDARQIKITVILTQNRMDYFVSYFQLCKEVGKIVPLITTSSVYKQFQKILMLVWGRQGVELLFEFWPGVDFTKYCRILEEEQIMPFDFEGSSMTIKKNLWHAESYDTMLILKGSKFIIETGSIKDEETLRGAWKKDIISEQQYCRLIDKTMFNLDKVQWVSSSPHKLHIGTDSTQLYHYMTVFDEKYSTFFKCQLFLLLPFDLLNQIYANGQTILYKKDQIIYKQGMKLTKLYIILKGKLCEERETPQILGEGDYFSRISLTGQQKKLTDLSCHSQQALVFSIDLFRLKYILGHFIGIFQQITHLIKQKTQKNTFISQWINLIILYNTQKHKNSQKVTFSKSVTLGSSEVSICRELWQKLCYLDLRMLFITKNTEYSENE